MIVSKNENLITIANNGKKLIIKKEDDIFEALFRLSKEEIIEWFERR